jgi:ligand-binding sensor domain-containing protein/signal transduction histidine kinase
MFAAMNGVGPSQAAESAGESETEYLVDVWRTEEGLPNNTVTGIAQTPDGYLWCGTYDGVVRFDGVRFVRIGPDDSTNQQANRVLCLHVDRSGHLWVGTDGAGVLLYADGAFTAFGEKPGSSTGAVRSIAEDAAGDLWLGTRGGLGRLRGEKAEGRTTTGLSPRTSDLSPLTSQLTWFTDAAGFTNTTKSTWSVAVDHDGRVWAADWGNLRFFKNDKFETALSGAAVQQPLRTVQVTGDGEIWTGMTSRAARRGADGQWKGLDDSGFFANAEVTAFCRMRSGDFWIGTRKGLYRLRDGHWAALTAREGLASSEVRVLFEDREGNLWVGTGTAGMARVKRRVLKAYSARHGLTDGGVMALREKPHGGLWVGMNNGRLAEEEAGTFHSVKGVGGWPVDAAVKSILFTRDGALWVGTFGNGLMRFHAGSSNQFTPTVGSPARIDKVTALLEDRAGTVWVGSYYSLYKAAGTNVVVQVEVGGRELRAPITALIESRAGGLWVACHGLGVLRLGPDRTNWLTRGDGLPTHLVRTLYEDSAGALWIGTEAGLCWWHEGRATTFTTTQGLTDDSVSQILEDDNDNLWLGTRRGIVRLAKADLRAVAEGRRPSPEAFVCGQGEGMLSLECSGGFCPAGLKTKDGRLWFPTAKGLVMVEPSALRRAMNSTPPPVYIEEARADGRLVARPHVAPGALSSPGARLDPLVLPPGTRRLEFVYTALSLTAPERVRFRHRLEGYDPDWTEAGAARLATYPKLPPGHYRFQVIACNNAGVWNETGHGLAFRIAAPFWRTWWFLSLGGIVFAAILAAGVRFVSVRQLRRRLRRLEEAHAIDKERMRIAQDMHDEVGGKLSRISFLSDLARRSIVETSEAGRQIDEVSEAARDVIRTVDEIVWAVSPRNDTLESLAHYICRHAEDFFELTPVELELELPAEFPVHRLSAEVRHNLFCAIKEALNNVLKHARASKVHIGFVIERATFRLTVADNGIGFRAEEIAAAFLAGSSGAQAVRRGDGLLNMRERLESIGGTCVIESQPGQGTRAVFTAPLPG